MDEDVQTLCARTALSNWLIPERIGGGCFVVGALETDPAPLLRLAAKLGWPVFADVTSEVRGWQHPWVVPAADVLVRVVFPSCLMRSVVHVGKRIVGRYFDDLFRETVVHDSWAWPGNVAKQPWAPGASAQQRLCAPLAEIFAEADALTAGWLEQSPKPWLSLKEELCRTIAEIPILSGLRNCLRDLHPNTVLFLGNSLSIRMAEVAAGRLPARVVCNRGASGIDGLLATAVGAAEGVQAPFVALLGDHSLLHDLNSLLLLRDATVPGVALIFNNGGGGIFSLLDLKNNVEHDIFSTCFTAPHGLCFADAASLFSLVYVNAKSENVGRVVCGCLERGERALVEVTVAQSEFLAGWALLQSRLRCWTESSQGENDV